MKVDCIIVGMGLAGCSLYWRLHQAGFICMCIDTEMKDTSSRVAAGMFNPIVGKRFTVSDRADEIFVSARQFYTDVESVIGQSVYYEKPLYMPFHDVAHQNDWSLKMSKLQSWVYDDAEMEHTMKQYYHSEWGGFLVRSTGFLDSREYIKHTITHCKQHHIFSSNEADYAAIDLQKRVYQSYEFDYIFFCEGAQVRKNPFVKNNFLNLAKGQLLWGESNVSIPQIIYNGKVYIIPVSDSNFIAGATYEWNYETEKPDDFGYDYLNDILLKTLKYKYTITDHQAAVRPTVIDRKPVLGSIDIKYPHAFIYNGLGTKGVILSPFISQQFIEHILYKKELPSMYHIDRFKL